MTKTRLLQLVFGLTAFSVVYALANVLSHAATDSTPGERVTIAQLPPAVKATLDREGAGGNTTEIEKISKEGKMIYRASIRIKGESQEITIGEDGAILERGGKDDDDDD
jgi:hypothetical protein